VVGHSESKLEEGGKSSCIASITANQNKEEKPKAKHSDKMQRWQIANGSCLGT